MADYGVPPNPPYEVVNFSISCAVPIDGARFDDIFRQRMFYTDDKLSYLFGDALEGILRG